VGLFSLLFTPVEAAQASLNPERCGVCILHDLYTHLGVVPRLVSDMGEKLAWWKKLVTACSDHGS